MGVKKICEACIATGENCASFINGGNKNHAVHRIASSMNSTNIIQYAYIGLKLVMHLECKFEKRVFFVFMVW